MNEGLYNYQSIVNDTFQTVGQAIGTHVMLLVVEHALWNTKHKYDEASLIEFSEDGITLDDLAKVDPELANDIAREFILAIIATLGRLVGTQLASQLAAKLSTHLGED